MDGNAINLTSLGLFSQFSLFVVLITPFFFLKESEDEGFNGRVKTKETQDSLWKWMVFLLISILAITVLSNETLSGVNTGLNESSALRGISRETILALYLTCDLITISTLVYSTGGPTLSPFTGSYSLIPVFALFLRLSDTAITVFAVLTCISLLLIHLITRSSFEEGIHRYRNSDLTCNILSIGVAVWIGLATRVS